MFHQNQSKYNYRIKLDEILLYLLFYFCHLDFNDISIAKLQELHWSLCNSIKMVNDNFGWQLFLQLFCNCVQLIVTPYLMIIDLFYPVIHNTTDLKFILIQVAWVFTHLCHLLLIVLPTSYATKKVNQNILNLKTKSR